MNDRWGRGIGCHHGGFYTCHDRYNPGYLIKHKWEDCFTVRHILFKRISVESSFFLQIDKHSWGYIRTSGVDDFLTIEKLLTQIITTVRLL